VAQRLLDEIRKIVASKFVGMCAMLIGSTSLFGAAKYDQGVNAANAAKNAMTNTTTNTTTNNDKSNGEGYARTIAATDGLTDSQRFTQRHAGLSASDYISSYFDFAEQNSAELLKSGQATDTFSMRFNDRTYTLAGKKLGGLNFQSAQLSDALVVPVAKAEKVPTAPRAPIDMMA
jgi:hypothetical protein